MYAYGLLPSNNPPAISHDLGVACFMPPAEQSLYASERSVNERMAQGRYLLDRLIQHFHPRTLPDTNHVLDDALTAFIMTSIAPSERSVESSLQYWLIFLKFVVQKLELHKDVPDLSEDDKEERRRFVSIPITNTRSNVVYIESVTGYGGQLILLTDMRPCHSMDDRG